MARTLRDERPKAWGVVMAIREDLNLAGTDAIRAAADLLAIAREREGRAGVDPNCVRDCDLALKMMSSGVW